MTLGPRWTTRIIVLPGGPLESKAPIASCRIRTISSSLARSPLPLCLGLPWIALLFSAANAILLVIRIRAERQR